MWWAKWLANFHFIKVYCPGSREGNPDALSRRAEYCLEEGGTHCEKTILKPEHFDVSPCQRKDQIQDSLVEGKKWTTSRLRIKRRQQNAVIPTNVPGWQQDMIFMLWKMTPTCPKTQVSRYWNCNVITQMEVRQTGGQKWQDNQTWNTSGRGYRCGLYRRDKSNTMEPWEEQLWIQGRPPYRTTHRPKNIETAGHINRYAG